MRIEISGEPHRNFGGTAYSKISKRIEILLQPHTVLKAYCPAKNRSVFRAVPKEKLFVFGIEKTSAVRVRDVLRGRVYVYVRIKTSDAAKLLAVFLSVFMFVYIIFKQLFLVKIQLQR
jgi:hypothetical protein